MLLRDAGSPGLSKSMRTFPTNSPYSSGVSEDRKGCQRLFFFASCTRSSTETLASNLFTT